MRYYTHLTFSFLVGILLIKYLSISNQILFIVLFMLFSLLPDIDEIKSKISQKVKPLSWLVNFFLGHRGLMHSIWISVILYLLLFLIRMDIAIAVSFGYLSHLILDCFTVSGVRLLWPLKKRLKGFVKTGSLIEYLIFVGLLIVDVYLLLIF
jgi:inner membrane protein